MSESNKKLNINHDNHDNDDDNFKNLQLDSSFRSFNDTDWGSLDDKELVAAINKLSQENKKLSQQRNGNNKVENISDDNRFISPVHNQISQDEILSSLPLSTLPDDSDDDESTKANNNNNKILSIDSNEKVKRNLMDSFRDSSFIDWDSFDDEEALMILDKNEKKRNNNVSEIIKKNINTNNNTNELETVSSILKNTKKPINNLTKKNEIKISELSKLSNINNINKNNKNTANEIESEIEDILDDDNENEEPNKLIINKDNNNTTALNSIISDSLKSVNVSKPIIVEHESIEDIDQTDNKFVTNEKNIETMDVDEDEDDEEEEEEDEEGKWGFGDYHTYFHNKRTKQQLADDEYINFINQKNPNLKFPKIFENCIIYVNGKTNPDISQLHKMIILHGGKFLHYLQSKGSVTHIIASNLTPRKKIEFKNYKVVKPDWIVESVSKGKLLHWFDYLLINNDYGQKKLIYRPQSDISERHDENDENEGEELYTDKLDTTTTDNDKLETTTNNEKLPIDAKDPNFLKYFFEKSRLHHLSNWKSELRAEFLSKAIEELKKKNFKQQKQNKKNSSNKQKYIMHIDFDCFFATVSALTHSPPIDINKYPVCVTHGGSNADIASCNYIARSKGVFNGMWFGQAIKLCPGLIKLDYKFEEYEKRSKEFYKILLEYEVNSILPISIDEALVDITDIYEDNNGHSDDNDNDCISKFIESIRDKIRIRTNGCIVSCGISTNVLLAKLSLRKAKPNGIFILDETYDNNEIKNQNLFKFLDEIEFKKLPGIGSSINNKLKNELKLREINLKQIRELISKEKLIKLFGIKTGEMIFNYCRGIDNTKIDILENPIEYLRKSVNVDVNWGIRFDDKLQVENFLTSMSKELNKRLHKIQSTGSQITLKLAKRHIDAPIEPAKYLGMGRCEFVSKSTRLGINTREIGIISIELKTIWRTLNIDPKELRGVSVSMTKLVNDEYKILEDTNQRKLPFKNIGKMGLEEKVGGHDNDSASTKTELVYKSMKENLKRDFDKMKDEQNDILTTFKKSKKKENYNIKSNNNITDTIDWDVFKELPIDIQKELKSELDKRHMINDNAIKSLESTPKIDRLVKLRVSPQKKKTNSPEQVTKLDHLTRSPIKLTKSSPTNLNLGYGNGNGNGVRSHTSTPFASPIKANHGISKAQYIDKDVFEQLPFEIQQDIMKEYNMDHQLNSVQAAPGQSSTGHPVSGVSRSKKPSVNDNNKFIINEEWVNNKMNKYNEYLSNTKRSSSGIKIRERFFNLKFQDNYNINKIYELINNWIKFSILNGGGPNNLDFKLFKNYLINLINLNDFIRFLNILDYIYKKLKFLNKYYHDKDDDYKNGIIEWFQLYDELKELKESINLSKLKFKF